MALQDKGNSRTIFCVIVRVIAKIYSKFLRNRKKETQNTPSPQKKIKIALNNGQHSHTGS